MKNCSLFFIWRIFSAVWMVSAIASASVFGQNGDTSQVAVGDTLQLPVEDTLHLALSDTLLFPLDSLLAWGVDTTLFATDTLLRSEELSDTLANRQDSVPKIVIIGLADPLDTLSNKLYAYQVLDRSSYARIQTEIDTGLFRFEINNPVMRNYYVGAYLGNTGLAYYPVGFEARKRPSDFLFTDHTALYMHIPEETRYYHTKVPYTQVAYSSAGAKAQNESVLSVLHSQNVNKRWNVGLDYDAIASAGQYPNQNSSDHAFSLFSAYRGSQYAMFANFNFNNIRMRENGGLVDINDFYDNEYAAKTNNMRSLSGKTILVNRSFYMNQSYSLRQLNLFNRSAASDSVNVSRFTLTHTLKYEWNKREFTDTATYAFRPRPSNFGTEQSGQTPTHDSLYFRRLSNHFELMIKEQARKKFTAGFSVGLLNETDRYNNNIIPDTSLVFREGYTPPASGWGSELPAVSWNNTVVNYRRTQRYFNTALTGRFFNHTGRYLNWDFNGRLYFTGYKAGDFSLDGMVQLHYYTTKGKNSLLLGGSIENALPSYFLNEYTSNWLAWKNDFEASQEIRLRAEFLMPHRKFKVGLYLSQLNNHVFINSMAAPEQSSEMLLVGTGFIEKDIRWWKLHFLFRLYGQYSSNENIIPLPSFAGYQSTYFEGWLVRDVMTVQIGWDVNYNTNYYAYAYMPSSGMFYLQNEQKIGGYPFFDAFINFQIKKARFFVKTEGLNTVFDALGKDYFMVYRYPLPMFRLKFGVSWAFYD